MAHSIIINAPILFSAPVTFQKPRPYTVIEWADNAVMSRLNSVNTLYTPTIYKRVFSFQDHIGSGNNNIPTYTRNLSGWTYDLRQQLTCASPWNSSGSGGVGRAGTLITPRHIILAAHFSLGPGVTVRFITADNQIVERTILQVKNHPDYTPFFPDISIALLDSDIPNTINYCSLLPSNYQEYFTTSSLSSFQINSECGVFYLDQGENAIVWNLYSFGGYVTPIVPTTNSIKLSAYEGLVSGDSSNPMFIIIDDKLVLLTVATFQSGVGTNLARFIPDINQLIQDVDTMQGINTGYQVTTYNLSNYLSLTAN